MLSGERSPAEHQFVERAKGELLVMFSDGIPEAPRGDDIRLVLLRRE
jgi:serine phosphatase RsbU (regulator of sigma subunit)